MSVLLAAFFFSFAYLVIALQLSQGLPPFYPKTDIDAPSKTFGGFIGLMMPIVLLPVVASFFHAGARVAFPAWDGDWIISAALVATIPFNLRAGWSLRGLVRDRSGGPLSWVLLPVFFRWPMLVFDLWSIGLCAFVAYLIIF